MNGAAAQVQLDLLRRPRLLAVGAEQPLSRKDAALLSVVALDGSAMRDTLATMLWPNADSLRARANLRQRRFRLARGAGAALLDGDERLTLAAHVAHPARDLDAALAADPDACDGEWLDGLAYEDCPEIERWLQLARERWRVLRSQALARVASAHENAERVTLALRLATRLAEHEPLSDHAHRRLMRLHHLRGDLGAALDVYRRFAERLDAELGELPDDETAALAASLRRGEAATRVSAPVPPTLARPVRRIGRDEAWATLQQAARQRAPLLIEGAPGVGKTRLLADFIAAGDASRMLLVPALAGDDERPYAVLSRLLARLWLDQDALRPHGADALPDWARSELAALLPELGAAPARVNALRLQRALALALQQAALDSVALDDLQQADRASIELLPALTGPGLPGWLLAVRAGEVPDGMQRWLHGSNAPQQLLLAPLTAQQLAELLDDLALPGVAGDAWARALTRHTGGLPLFVLETLRGLYQQGRPALDALPSSTGAAQAVRARAARLPDAARQVAHVAAVLRAPLALADTAALLGGQAADWRDAFAAVEAAQWLDADGRMHDLVGAALRDAMPAAERRWLHGSIAAWMVASHAPALMAAQHYDAAGRDAEAAPLFEAAGLAARRASRPAEDAVLWERAAAAWERAGRPDRAFNALRESLAPRSFAGGTGVTLPVTQRLLAMARTPAERMAALGELAHALGHDGDHVRAVGPAREAYAIARSLDDTRERLKMAGILAQQLSYVEQADEALALLAELRPVADQLGGEPLQLYLNGVTQALHRASRLAECADALRQSVRLLVADENWREATTVGGNLALVLGNLGLYEEASELLQQVAGWRRQLGELEGTMLAGHDLKTGHVMLGLGRIGSAIAAYERSRAQYAANGASDAWLVSCDNGLAMAHLLRGDAAAAARCLLPFTTAQPAFMRARRALLQAQVAAEAGQDPAPALAAARDAVAGTPDVAAQTMVDAEAAWLEGGARDASVLVQIESAARGCEQQALAARVAWWRVAALRDAGDAPAAAYLARELLAQPAWPSVMLPAHWLRIAHDAFAAAGDGAEAAALGARAQAAWATTCSDLAEHGRSPPPTADPPRAPAAR
jgi:DNA-binding SARP family transcriptional activator